VQRAIDIVQAAIAASPANEPVYVRKHIVHNNHVVARLEAQGAVFVDELDEVPPGATVVFSAHGVSLAVREQAAARDLDVIDATCPLVSKIHAEARRYASRGDTIILISHRGHDETVGTVGHAPGQTVLIETADEVADLVVADPSRVSYLTQSTLALDEVAGVIQALRERFPLIQEPPSEDICYATTNRQNAVRALLPEADLLLVVGSSHSANSALLADLARRAGTAAHLIDSSVDIDPAWLESAATVAVSAGASALPAIVEEVVAAIRALGPVIVTERSVTTETVHFALPRKVRAS
jgi:4-hydroxy-3-methylbut-2-enyl diphosphate reductase